MDMRDSRIADLFSGLRGVAFTFTSSTHAVLSAFGSGARAFVLKRDPPDVLVEALRAASRGEYHLSEISLAALRRELLPEVQVDPLPRLAGSEPLLN
jgi:DNA-binding NarL/FixJ family response regulator